MTTEAFDLSRSDEDLASAVVALPDGTDLQGVGLRPLLIGPAEGRNPGRYAAIFTQAAAQAPSRWLQLACRRQVVNGKRRDPDADMRAVAAELSQVRMEVSTDLPSGPLQWGLAAECGFDHGLILRMLREYLAACHAQLQAAVWALGAGKTTDALVYQFVAAVEAANHFLIRRQIYRLPEDFPAAFAHLRQLRTVVKTTTDPYPDWMAQNATLHIVWACWMAEMDYPERADDLAQARQTPFQHWQALMDCIALLEEGRADEALDAAQSGIDKWGLIKSSSHANVFLSLQLIKARVLSNRGDQAYARALLQEVRTWSGQDGGVPMAVAARLLAV